MLIFHDHHENIVDLISCEENTTEVTVCCDGIVEVQDAHGITGDHAGLAPLWLYLRGNKRHKGRHARSQSHKLADGYEW